VPGHSPSPAGRQRPDTSTLPSRDRDVSEVVPRVPTEQPARGRLESSVLATIASAAPLGPPPRDREDRFVWGDSPSSGPDARKFPGARDSTDAIGRLRADPFTSVDPEALVTLPPAPDECDLRTVNLSEKADLPSPATDLQALPYQLEWVVGGDLAGYVSEFGDRLWPIPESYTALERDYPGHRPYPVYVGQAHGPLYQYAYGLAAAEVERALRALTGGGRYSADEYALVACGQAPAVLVGPEGAVLLRVEPVPRPKQTPTALEQRCKSLTAIETEAGALRVEEQSPAVVAGLARVCAAFEAGDLPDGVRPVGSLSPPRAGAARHTFETTDGSSVVMDPDDLRRLAGLGTGPSDVAIYDGGTVQPAEYASREEPVDLSWTPEDGEPTTFAAGGRRRTSTTAALGWQFEWEQRRGRKYEAQVVRYDLSVQTDQFGPDQLAVTQRTSRLGVY
jgi:hypothetical protein